MVWYGMVWYGMVWYGMVWYGMVWYGMVWYGVVWCGVVWCGVVWYGMVIKQMVNGSACTIESWMYLGGWLSTQEARVALGDSFVLNSQPPACIYNSIVHAEPFTIC